MRVNVIIIPGSVNVLYSFKIGTLARSPLPRVAALAAADSPTERGFQAPNWSRTQEKQIVIQ
jgi:hypothetical protein